MSLPIKWVRCRISLPHPFASRLVRTWPAALSRYWVIQEEPVAWLPGDSIRCSKCGSDNPAGAKFCDGCAAPLALQCSSCGASNRASAKFCIECASPLGAVPVAAGSSGAAQPARPEKHTIALGAPLEPHDVPEGERKTVRRSSPTSRARRS
jgi:hypothetical protein